MDKTVYQLKVTLSGTRPAIWRRLEVEAEITLGRLHMILQLAMGWTDSHMHQFSFKGHDYGRPHPDYDLPMEDEDRARLDQILQKPKDRMLYEYDFGDSWVHGIVLERIVPFVPGRGRYPRMISGRGACPPEDCGGVDGFYHLLDVLNNPHHPEYRELLEWVGGEFDAGKFDAQKFNRAFHGGWGRP